MPIRVTRALAVVLLLVLVACARVAPDGTAIERPSGVPQQDFARAVALQREGRHSQSVPFFRAAAEADPGVALLHLELGKALNNASIQMDFSGRAVRFVVGRSQDRAQLRREALAEAERAAELANTAQEAGTAWFVHAHMLELSGDVAGALTSVERALAITPGEATLGRERERLIARLRETP